MTAVTPGSAGLLAKRDRLLHVITTMTNDDMSKPGTMERHRLIEREEAIRDAAELLERLAAKPAEEVAQASSLVAAWRRYVDLFGEPPHGTEKQMRALLRLIPPSRCPPLSATGEPKR